MSSPRHTAPLVGYSVKEAPSVPVSYQLPLPAHEAPAPTPQAKGCGWAKPAQWGLRVIGLGVEGLFI